MENGRKKVLWNAQPGDLEQPYPYYPSREATDFYHQYPQDIALLAQMGVRALRLSVSWTRIFPNGEEETPNAEGLAFYDALFAECKKYDIEPVVTICHFDTPYALYQKFGGWRDRRMVDCYLRLCKVLFERYHQQVKYWMTFNEINMVLHGLKLFGAAPVQAAKQPCKITEVMKPYFGSNGAYRKRILGQQQACFAQAVLAKVFLKAEGKIFAKQPAKIALAVRQLCRNVFRGNVRRIAVAQ